MIATYKFAVKKHRERQARRTQTSPGNGEQQSQNAQQSICIEVGSSAVSADPAVKSQNDSDKAKEQREAHVQSEEEAAAKKRRRSYRRKIIIGLFCPFALQALDTTIIASALPFIATDFSKYTISSLYRNQRSRRLTAWPKDEVKQLNWIISSFNLTSSAFLPFWAQLTDIFGRHATVQASLVTILAGSAICTGTPTTAFGVLLLGRALQGIGVAGANIAVRTIIADRVSLSEYAANWAIFAMVAGGSYSVGPVAGGFLTRASWRWCFAVNLPVAVVAILLIALLLRRELLGPQPLLELEGRDTTTRQGRLVARLSTIDFGGQLLFLWGLGLLSLALTWGGGTHPWNSAAVLAPLILGSVLSVGWVLYERSMAPGGSMARIFPYQRAMMAWELLSQRDMGLLFLINVTAGMAMFAVLYFADLYFALVEGKSSSDAGLSLLYFIPGISGMFSYSISFQVHPKKNVSLIYLYHLPPFCEILLLISLSRVLAGGLMATYASNIWPRQTLPSLLLGGITTAVGITVLPWAMHAQKTSVVYGMMALIGHGVFLRLNPSSIHGLAYFPEMTSAIACLMAFAIPFGGLVGLTIMSTIFTNKSGTDQADVKNGIVWAFIAMVPFMWVCVVLTTLLGNVWIRKDGGHEIVDGAWLWSFVTRKKLVREKRMRGDGSGELVALESGKDVGDPEAKMQNVLK